MSNFPSLESWRGAYYYCGAPFLWLVVMMTIMHVFKFRAANPFKNPVERALDFAFADFSGIVLGGLVLGVSLLALRRLEPIVLRKEDWDA